MELYDPAHRAGRTTNAFLHQLVRTLSAEEPQFFLEEEKIVAFHHDIFFVTTVLMTRQLHFFKMRTANASHHTSLGSGCPCSSIVGWHGSIQFVVESLSMKNNNLGATRCHDL
jgi:hypothetical protein